MQIVMVSLRLRRKEHGVLWLLILLIRELAGVRGQKRSVDSQDCLINWVVAQSSPVSLVTSPKLDSLCTFWLGWLLSHTWDPLLSPNSSFYVTLLGSLNALRFNNKGIELLLYDCQLLGLRKAILNFVLVKQLAQGTDVECVVFVHCLLVWPLNPGDWQGLPNCGEEETSIRAPSQLKLPIPQRGPHTETQCLGPLPFLCFFLLSQPHPFP